MRAGVLKPTATQWLMHLFAPFFGLMLGLLVTYWVECTFLPVVTDFKITALQPTATGWAVSGSYNKRRACELITTNIVSINQSNPSEPGRLLHQIHPTEIGSNLPVGAVYWGPYQIPAPPDWGSATHVQAVSVHKCHALWTQETLYATLPVSAFRRP